MKNTQNNEFTLYIPEDYSSETHDNFLQSVGARLENLKNSNCNAVTIYAPSAIPREFKSIDYLETIFQEIAKIKTITTLNIQYLDIEDKDSSSAAKVEEFLANLVKNVLSQSSSLTHINFTDMYLYSLQDERVTSSEKLNEAISNLVARNNMIYDLFEYDNQISNAGEAITAEAQPLIEQDDAPATISGADSHALTAELLLWCNIF